MTYIIQTTDANSLIKEIMDCCNYGIDHKGKEIKSWKKAVTQNGVFVLVHTNNQWKEKCNIHLDANDDNDEIYAKVVFWSSFKKEDRSGDEPQYMLGRLTELLLVHFHEKITALEVNV